MANLGIKEVLFPILHNVVDMIYHLLPDLRSPTDGVLGTSVTPDGVSVSLAIVPHHPESPEKRLT